MEEFKNKLREAMNEQSNGITFITLASVLNIKFFLDVTNR